MSETVPLPLSVPIVSVEAATVALALRELVRKRPFARLPDARASVVFTWAACWMILAVSESLRARKGEQSDPPVPHCALIFISP